MANIDLLDFILDSSRVENFQTTLELSKNTSDIYDKTYIINIFINWYVCGLLFTLTHSF